METDYKKLFQKILPKITYNYPSPCGISYDITYENILVTEKTISFRVDYNRTTPYNKITVVRRLLNEVLRHEIRDIERYVNLKNKAIMIECKKSEEQL